MNRIDRDRHVLDNGDEPRRPSKHAWQERETVPPPFRLWAGFLFILVALLAWGIVTGWA